jgi:hypothetical protein
LIVPNDSSCLTKKEKSINVIGIPVGIYKIWVDKNLQVLLSHSQMQINMFTVPASTVDFRIIKNEKYAWLIDSEPTEA